MKKVKSLQDLQRLMETLGATKETEPGFTRWTLRFHELCVLLMLAGGALAYNRARSMKATRNVTRSPDDALAPASTLRIHRRAGWAGVVGSVLGLLSAAVVLAGMYQRM